MTQDEKGPQVKVVDRRWWARGVQPDAPETAASLKPTYVEELEQRLADANKQLQSYIAERRKALEEFDQARVRLRRDTAREVERGKRAVLVELLEVVDNLDRAIAAARETGPSLGNESADNLVRGVALVRDQFLAKLEAFGVVRVPALTHPFDATRHDAVTTTPVSDPAQDGIVVAVLKEGYTVADELLRPASVVVGRHQREI